MNAGGEDRGGIVSGFTGGYMGGCWIGSVGIVLGVCRGGGTTGGAGGGSWGVSSGLVLGAVSRCGVWVKGVRDQSEELVA